MPALTCLAVAALLLLLAWWWSRRGGRKGQEEEGFAAGSGADAPNALLAYVDSLKAVSRHVGNPSTWTERLRLARMTPAQLARAHLGLPTK